MKYGEIESRYDEIMMKSYENMMKSYEIEHAEGRGAISHGTASCST